MICKKCGAELAEGTEVCSNCGEVQDAGVRNNQEFKSDLEFRSELEFRSNIESNAKSNQIANNLIENEETSVNKTEKAHLRVSTLVKIISVLVVLIVVGIFAKQYMHYYAIKSDPVGAYKNAIIKECELDRYKNQLIINMKLKNQNQSYNLGIICDSVISAIHERAVHNLTLNVKYRDAKYSIKFKAYQINKKLYINVPQSKRYLYIDNMYMNNSDKKYKEMKEKLLDKVANEINKRIKKDDIDVSKEDAEIGDENVSAVKSEFNISEQEQTSRALLESILKIMIADKGIQETLKKNNIGMTNQQLDVILNDIDTNFDTAMKKVKIKDAKAISYIDSDGYPVRSELKFHLVPMQQTGGVGDISLDIKSLLKDRNGYYTIKIPNNLDANSSSIGDVFKSYINSQNMLNQFSTQLNGNQSY